MLDQRRLSYWRRRVFIVAWVTYACYYTGRVNVAVALPAMEQDLSLSRVAVGLLGSGFYWVYAVSQLVNGHLGDRVSPRRMVAGGLVVSAALNLIVGSMSSFVAIAVVWALNGWAQATGWGPIMRGLSRWFAPGQRGRLVALFSPCYVVGNALSWGLAGWLVSRGGWRWTFWGPGALLILVSALWFVGMRDEPGEVGLSDARVEPSPRNRETGRSIKASLTSVLEHPTIRPALGVCFLSGMVKDGLSLWGPLYLMEQGGLTLAAAALRGVAIPLAGAAGALLAGWMVHRSSHKREMPVIGTLGGLVVLAGAMLYLFAGRAQPVVVLVLLCAMALGSHGTNALLLSAIPLSLGANGRVSGAAGTLDFVSYAGAGLSAVLVGWLQDLVGWSGVYVWWIVVACAIVYLALRNVHPSLDHSTDARPATEA